MIKSVDQIVIQELGAAHLQLIKYVVQISQLEERIKILQDENAKLKSNE